MKYIFSSINLKIWKIFSFPNKIYFLLFFNLIIFLNYNLFAAYPNLNQKLTPIVFQEWDKYIRENAPSDSAFNVVVQIARQHYFSGRAIVSWETYKLYEDLFPNKKVLLERELKSLIQVALTQSPIDMHRFIYAQLAEELKDTDDGFVAIQRYAEKFIKLHQFDSAANVFKMFESAYPKLSWKLKDVEDILLRKEEPVQVNHLPKPINTNQEEWDPNPTPDGKYLFFSGMRSGTLGGNDVFVSKFINGSWSAPKSLGKPIDSQNNETIDNVSVDGNTLMLSGNFAGTFGKFDIYSANAEKNGWGNLYHFPMPINSEYQDESGYLTSDGKAIIFTSDRPGGIAPFVPYGIPYNGSRNGNMDIYVCLKTKDGWSKPINLGPTINTPFSERSAFLHPDGKTLYFSSEGHPGLGRLDVFKSIRLSDSSWTDWSEPVNLGRYINSVEDDWGYKIGLTGDSAFFSSNSRPEGFGGLDLYTVTLPKKYKPLKVASVRGRVLDVKSFPIFASIKWQDLETGQDLGDMRSNPATGDYFIALPLGKNIGFYAEKAGFYPTSGNIDLTNVSKDTNLIVDIILISQKEFSDGNQKITINNIFFDYAQSVLKPESFLELNRLIDFLKNIGNVSIVIEGHTDNIGSDEYNFQLSLKRGTAVGDYLIKNGIPSENIKVIPKGSSEPKFPNDSPEHKSMNRRVEIYVKKS